MRRKTIKTLLSVSLIGLVIATSGEVQAGQRRTRSNTSSSRITTPEMNREEMRLNEQFLNSRYRDRRRDRQVRFEDQYIRAMDNPDYQRVNDNYYRGKDRKSEQYFNTIRNTRRSQRGRTGR